MAFGGLLVAGMALRVWAMLAYSPAVLGSASHDGAGYIRAARRGFEWGDFEPSGYPLFLRVVHVVSRRLDFAISVQHALGLATGVLLFLIVRRLAGPAWLGLVPAGIVWLGGDQLFLEHAPMSEALFTALLAAALYAGVRCLDGGWRWPLAAGALCAALLSVRTIGLLIPVVLLGWLAASRWRTHVPLRRGMAAALAAAVVVAVAYGTIRENATGHWSLVPQASGWVVYARAAEFADCREFNPPPGTAVLCDRTPPSSRKGPSYYLWWGGPAYEAFGGPAAHDGDVRRFALAAIAHQPLDFIELAGTDLVRYAAPDFRRARHPGFVGPEKVTFPSGRPDLDPKVQQEAAAYYGPRAARPQPPGTAEGLRSYQRVVRVNGWELFVLLGLGLGGVFAAQGRVRWGLILLLAVGLELLLVPVLTYAEWRYAVPAEGPIACTAAIGAWLLAQRMRQRGQNPRSGVSRAPGRGTSGSRP
jgi:hypothetical protein